MAETGVLPSAREIAPGYRVPPLIVGLWQLSAGHRPADGADRGPDRAAAVADLLRFVDAGLGTFDCADIYTGVEDILGDVHRARPGQVRVHTKFVPDRSVLQSIDRGYVEKMINRSLKRLGVERLDLVQFHWWDWEVPGWIDAAGWLQRLQQSGKIRLLGVTNFDAAHLQALREAGIVVATDQVQYSLLDRRPSRTLAAWAAANDLWLLCYGTVAGGLLGERWLGLPSPAPAWPNRSLQKYGLMVEECGGWGQLQALLQRLRPIADEYGVGIAELAVRVVLDRPRVGAVIVGARDARHLPRLQQLLAMPLPVALRDRIEAAGATPEEPRGDVYALEREAGGRHAAIIRTDLNRNSAVSG